MVGRIATEEALNDLFVRFGVGDIITKADLKQWTLDFAIHTYAKVTYRWAIPRTLDYLMDGGYIEPCFMDEHGEPMFLVLRSYWAPQVWITWEDGKPDDYLVWKEYRDRAEVIAWR